VLRFHKYTGRAEDALADRVIVRTTVEWIGRRSGAEQACREHRQPCGK
jgi:hypothetical protein